ITIPGDSISIDISGLKPKYLKGNLVGWQLSEVNFSGRGAYDFAAMFELATYEFSKYPNLRIIESAEKAKLEILYKWTNKIDIDRYELLKADIIGQSLSKKCRYFDRHYLEINETNYKSGDSLYNFLF